MDKLLSEIESYWSTRAEGYSEVNHKELNGIQKEAWLKTLKRQFPEKKKEELKILDIGTGSRILSRNSCRGRIQGYSCRLYTGNA